MMYVFLLMLLATLNMPAVLAQTSETQTEDQKIEQLRVENENLKKKVEIEKLRKENEELKKTLELETLQNENVQLKKQQPVTPTDEAVKQDQKQKIRPDFSNDNRETLLDANFIAERGRVILITGAERSKSSAEVQYLTRPSYTYKESELSASAGFEIGLFKKTSFGAELSYILTNEAQYHYGVASTRNGQTDIGKDKSFYDPVFSFKHQLLSQESSPVYFDVELEYSPKLMKSENASTTKKGSPGKGGSAIGMGGRFTKKTHFITSYIQGRYFYVTNTKSKNLEDGSQTATDWRDGLLAGIGLQKFLTQSTALELGLNYFWDNAYTISDDNSELHMGPSKGTEIIFQFSGYSQSKNALIGLRQSFVARNEHDVLLEDNVYLNVADGKESNTLLFVEIYL